MRKLLRTLAISAALLGPASAAQAQVSFDITIGQPPPPPRWYRVPRQPGPDYEWIEGYWYPQGSHYAWHNGYWTRPPYVGAYWVAPYYSGGRYFAGRWEGPRGYIDHDHRWDHSQKRDEHRDRRDDREYRERGER
ncbi:MAG TPA: YXWGXW repeat-containing protein [Vicinamibacterales bacterium]